MDTTTTDEPQGRPASQFARDVAEALTDPVVIALLTHIVSDAITAHQRREQALAAVELAAQQQDEPTPITNVQRASRATAWVGQRAAHERAKAGS